MRFSGERAAARPGLGRISGAASSLSAVRPLRRRQRIERTPPELPSII